MAQGYTRNDTSNNIADASVIDAVDLDGEFDAIVAAFTAVTGHAHDGTAANGATIGVLGPNQDIVITSDNFRPKTDNSVDLGTSTLEFKDLYIDGVANIDSLVADTADINAGTIDGVTIATSDITVGTGKTLNVSAGTLTLADNQISGDKVEGGTINATTINTLTSTTVNTTTVDTTNLEVTNLEVTNLKAKDGTSAGTVADVTGLVTLTSLASGGTVNFSGATVSNGGSVTTVDINGGTVDGTTVGATTASTVRGTTITATTGFSGNLTGDVTGDLTGDVYATSLFITGTEITAGMVSIFVGVTSTTAELNILDGATLSTAELNILDGMTSTTAELNILDGVTSTTAELNILDGVTASAAEINYLDITTLGVSQASKVVTSDANGVTTFADGVNEGFTSVTSTSNATTVNCRNGNVFSHTLTENTTFTFSNPPATGTAYGMIIKLVQGSPARSVTWPTSVDWSFAASPNISSNSGDVDVFVFLTHDGGTNWYGFTAGQDLS